MFLGGQERQKTDRGSEEIKYTSTRRYETEGDRTSWHVCLCCCCCVQEAREIFRISHQHLPPGLLPTSFVRENSLWKLEYLYTDIHTERLSKPRLRGVLRSGLEGMAAQFDALNRKAKSLESRLEVSDGHDYSIVINWVYLLYIFIHYFQKKIQSYSTVAQKINADFLCDEGSCWIM